jgi:uncharacterized membrane protein YcaP (DUF421 family)
MFFLTTICARTAIILLFLVVGLRVLGKRQIGQMNIYDLALIMALANAVQNAMTNGAGDLSVGIVSAGTLLGIGWLMTRLFVHLPRLEERVVGMPTLLVNDGQLFPERMRREHVTEDQLLMAIRQHGLNDIKEVLMAVLEVDGSISIVPKISTNHRVHRRGKTRKQE